MGNNNMAVYQFSNAELELLKQALNTATDATDITQLDFNNMMLTVQTINAILAARSNRG
jgi:hypothetical protein